MIKSRRMRWVGHEARMGSMRNSYSISGGKPEDLGADEKNILEWLLGNMVERCELDADFSG
jgi:hypothetical protein